MFKDKEIRKGVISSIIASLIFLIFFQPILGFVWTLIVKFSSNYFSGYINGIYKSAALGQRNWIDFITLLIIIVSFFTSLFIIIILLRKTIYNFQKLEKINSTVDEKEKQILIKNYRDNANKRKSFYMKHSKKILYFYYLYLILTIIPFAGLGFSAYADLQLNTSFNQRLNALGPYIDDQQEEIFKSKWALMKSRRDFELLNNEIEIIAKSKNITLPKNLLK